MVGKSDIADRRDERIPKDPDPEAADFLAWVRSQAEIWHADLVLILDPVYARFGPLEATATLPHTKRLSGAEDMFLLADIPPTLLEERLSALALRFHGSTPAQVFQRFGIPCPAHSVLADLGLSDDQRFGFGNERLTRRFIHGFKWHFSRVALKARGDLFRQLVLLGARPCMRIALVDVGPGGGLLDASARAIQGLMDIALLGLCLSLEDPHERLALTAHLPLATFHPPTSSVE